MPTLYALAAFMFLLDFILLVVHASIMVLLDFARRLSHRRRTKRVEQSS